MNDPITPTCTLLDLPVDAIRLIFGYHNCMNQVELGLMNVSCKASEEKLNTTLINVMGSHVCTYIRDALMPSSIFSGISELAAAADNLKLVKWAISVGYHPEDGANICAWAAFNGNLPMLKWAKSRGYSLRTQVTSAAARAGNYKTFKWIVSNRGKYDDETHAEAMRGGSIKILKWLHEDGFFNGEFDGNYLVYIIKNAPLAAIIWALDNGYVLGPHIFVVNAIEQNRLDIIEWINDVHPNVLLGSRPLITPQKVVQNGSAEMINWFVVKGYLTDYHSIATCALTYNRVDICEWCETHWGMKITPAELHKSALTDNSFEMITYLIKRGGTWPMNTIQLVIEKDIKDVKTYKEVPFTMSMVESVNMKRIEHIVAEGCPWTPGLLQLYKDAEMPDRVKWLRSIGCPE